MPARTCNAHLALQCHGTPVLSTGMYYSAVHWHLTPVLSTGTCSSAVHWHLLQCCALACYSSALHWLVTPVLYTGLLLQCCPLACSPVLCSQVTSVALTACVHQCLSATVLTGTLACCTGTTAFLLNSILNLSILLRDNFTCQYGHRYTTACLDDHKLMAVLAWGMSQVHDGSDYCRRQWDVAINDTECHSTSS